ncbi:hypothetical protein CALCODRAFT_324214 [Calocera cornea HHB12733]|uniref:Uncharacterized protein n=1 Tax=Calocera cornea HHB12733 TaxID=1353952 RepID=A0A165F475_9BASI|nr:hypothetical protein CALCODRAFT_324214 [Calocera cornea HHB12733]
MMRWILHRHLEASSRRGLSGARPVSSRPLGLVLVDPQSAEADGQSRPGCVVPSGGVPASRSGRLPEQNEERWAHIHIHRPPRPPSLSLAHRRTGGRCDPDLPPASFSRRLHHPAVYHSDWAPHPLRPCAPSHAARCTHTHTPGYQSTHKTFPSHRPPFENRMTRLAPAAPPAPPS